MSDATISLISAGIGALSVLAGLFIKTLIDNRRDRRREEREDAARFLEERRDAYDTFLHLVKKEYEYSKWLRDLALIVRDGGEEPPEAELATAPPSPMKDLIKALERIDRIARSYQVIEAARNIVRLFSDMARANRRLLDAVAPQSGTRETVDEHAKQNDDITWFILCRLVEDREREFVYAYRADLGLRNPLGGPPLFPIADRPWPAEVPEHFLRKHVLPTPLVHDQRTKGDKTMPQRGTATDATQNALDTDEETI
jgi:hypothetical protein